eukprot:3993348-Alexandrium_andersonii.AAC.1
MLSLKGRPTRSGVPNARARTCHRPRRRRALWSTMLTKFRRQCRQSCCVKGVCWAFAGVERRLMSGGKCPKSV